MIVEVDRKKPKGGGILLEIPKGQFIGYELAKPKASITIQNGSKISIYARITGLKSKRHKISCPLRRVFVVTLIRRKLMAFPE